MKRRVVESPEMKGVAGRIQQWRQSRTKLGAMPAELWAEATSLAQTHGVHRVARALGLNYHVLKQRVTRKPTGGGPGRENHFIEVSSAPLLRSGPETAAVVEVVSPHGARLTIRLPGGRLMEAAELVSAFSEGCR